MSESVSEPLFRRSAEHLAAYAREAFHVDMNFTRVADGGPEVCLCGLHPGRNEGGVACRKFSNSLLAAASPRSRCPEGLLVIARPFAVPTGERALLCTRGFLESGEQLPSGVSARGAGAAASLARLDPDQIGLLERFVVMGADLLASLTRETQESGVEGLREALWRDLLGAPTISGVSAAIRTVRESLPTLANSREPLFIQGEPGSGRHLLAAAVHRLGPRHGGPFVAEDLSVLPEAAQERELFGQERTTGLMEEAEGGTLYLSRVERLGAVAQRRLAEQLAGEARPHGGGRRSRRPEVRIIASAESDLDEAVRKGHFRRDLATRLRALVLTLPPLRERPEDIPPLVERLLARHAAALGTPPPAVDPAAMEALRKHPWAGNVRELDEELARASVGKSVIRVDDLSVTIASGARAPKTPSGADLRQAVGELESGLILRTLGDTNWNKSRAARLLGLSRLGLQKKIDRYGIDRRR